MKRQIICYTKDCMDQRVAVASTNHSHFQMVVLSW